MDRGKMTNRSLKGIVAMVAVATFALIPAVATATTLNGWDAFVIRNSSTAVAPTINSDVAPYSTPNLEFVIALANQKAGLGTNALNGSTVGSIANLSIDRLDDAGRFTAGSGPAVAPYMNFWIKDSAGNYAVLANEPSNGEWNTPNDPHNTDWATLSTKTAKVYENSGFILPSGPLTFASFANYVIEAPSAALLAAGWGGLGSGAPRELGTNVAYGFNWVFGDTLSNYVSGAEGYVVANPSAAAVTPTPVAATAGLVLMGLTAMKRRRA